MVKVLFLNGEVGYYLKQPYALLTGLVNEFIYLFFHLFINLLLF